MTESETGDAPGRLRSRLRLVPLTSVLPMLAATTSQTRADTNPPDTGGTATASARSARPVGPTTSRTDLRRAAESLVELCAQVLRGRHPLSAVRRIADARAFSQFTTLYRRTRPPRPNADPVSLRLSHTDTDPSGALTMVALINAGNRVRAVSLLARRRPTHGWQLTLCQLIEPRR